MPLTLWRHLLAELFKVLGITTGIIVTVISFGLTAKTMADNLIGVEMVPKYLVLAIIPIIVFYLVCQKYIVSGVMAGAVKG